jgi:nitrate reductase NapE component
MNQKSNVDTLHQRKGKGIMAKVTESLIVPVVLPVWSIICAVVVGAFGFGINYQQLSSLVESQKKVDLIYERQITNIEAVKHLNVSVQQLDQRVAVLERKER